jgi:DNA-binding NarL/FixJ family response regulator
VERCAGLEIAVRAYARLDDDRAGSALDQLRQLASRAPTPPLQAAVLASEGTLAASRDEQDAARRSFEDALDVLVAMDAPFEAARVRLDLAATLVAQGRHPEARREIDAALAAFQKLGAEADAARAQSMLGRLRGARPTIRTAEGPLGELSKRELEVLALVSEGLTNQEIAERLVLSKHTVNRHVANILRKLGLPSRVAAASLAGRLGLE